MASGSDGAEQSEREEMESREREQKEQDSELQRESDSQTTLETRQYTADSVSSMTLSSERGHTVDGKEPKEEQSEILRSKVVNLPEAALDRAEVWDGIIQSGDNANGVNSDGKDARVLETGDATACKCK